MDYQAVQYPRGLSYLFLLLLWVCGLSALASPSGDGTAYLFTYFTGKGDQGLCLAWSSDAYHWEALNGGAPVFAPTVGKDRLLRDPCAVQGPDGTYHLLWTTGWWDRSIGYSSTRDFLDWTPPRALPVMEHEPRARNAWAPEAIWDAQREHFLLFWATTVTGAFQETEVSGDNRLNHRLYATTTKDWLHFSPTRLLSDPGFNVIDATFLPSPGQERVLVVKDETIDPPKKCLRLARADDWEGPWKAFGPAISRAWVEGPGGLRVGDEYLVFFDIYREKRYGALRSRDFSVWEDVSPRISLPEGARHGTFLAVPRALVDRLIDKFQAKPAPDLGSPAAVEEKPQDPALPSLFIAGDSTAARSSDKSQQGWGEAFKPLWDTSKINIVNRARGGRSSRTFITEGLWDKLASELKAGDFVLLQFGHNDSGAVTAEPPGSTRPLRARGSLPGLGEEVEEIDNVLTQRRETVHTFGWYLRKMVHETKAKGATPLLVSLTLRNVWREGRIERGSGSYRTWLREIAATEGVPFVDLSRLLAETYQDLGEDRVRAYFARDHTHTSPLGAELNAQKVLEGLKGLKGLNFEIYVSERGRAVQTDTLGWLQLPEPDPEAGPCLFLIGDSTVRNGSGQGTGAQWGWGDFLAQAMPGARLTVVNRAVGGLSSRTFLTQGFWHRLCGLVRKGDFLLIQFGHNDSSPVNDTARARGTLPGLGAEEETIDNRLTHQRETVKTYGAYLRAYVREARSLGVEPILCSPVPRKRWKEGIIEGTTTTYTAWAREVAEEEKVAFLDLDGLLSERYRVLGRDQLEGLFADEHTHTSREGACLSASVVAEALKSHGPENLKALLSP